MWTPPRMTRLTSRSWLHRTRTLLFGLLLLGGPVRLAQASDGWINDSELDFVRSALAGHPASPTAIGPGLLPAPWGERSARLVPLQSSGAPGASAEVAILASREPAVPMSGSGTGRATLVRITLVRQPRLDKVMYSPEGLPPPLSFTHSGGTPIDRHPHSIDWEISGLTSGERAEIRLDTSFPGFRAGLGPARDMPWAELLQALFPSAVVLPGGHLGWSFTAATPKLSSGAATSPVGRYELANRIHFHFVYFDAAGNAFDVDPDVEVTPDP